MHHYDSDKIRNVALTSHSGAGKTTIAEATLFATGAISRLGSVVDGTSTGDYEPEETKRKMSINLAILPCEWKEAKLNLIDSPGYPDFAGEVKAGLRVCEAAVVVVCGASGVQVGTEQVWKYVSEANLPCLVLINRMDRENADFFKVLEEVQRKLDKNCLPMQLPIGSQKEFGGVTNLLTMKSFGAASKEVETPAGVSERGKPLRDKFIEAVVETDDELLSKYLEGGEISSEEMNRAVKRAITLRKVYPVLAASGLRNIGVVQFLDIISDYLPTSRDWGVAEARGPSGTEEKLEPITSSALATLVFKTSADPYIGKLSYLRVYSGAMSSNSQVWNAGKSAVERIGQLFVLRGKGQEAVSQLKAGDIGAVAKLALAATGDTFSSKEHPLTLSPVDFPKPMLSMAVYPKSKADLDKMSTVLPRMIEEDPTLQMRRDLDTAELILSGLGDMHLEVTAEKIHRKFGVEVKLEIPKVPYKETIKVPVKTEYKHKKQTGGHGQYGHVLLALDPLPKGTGFEFVEKVVGGAVPRNYIPAIEKGVNEARQEGVLAGYPLTDVRVTLYDGSFHAVDSSDIAFKIASIQAVKKGLSDAQPVLQEPIDNLTVTVPENTTGDVIGDLNTKRGRVLGINREGNMSVIRAQVPLAEILRYAVDLRALTHGRGTYSVEFSHYEEVPAHVTQKIVAEKQAEKA